MIAQALLRTLEKRQRPADHDDYWYAYPGRVTESGVYITPETARTLSAVYLCVKILAETVFSLPLDVYRRLDNGDKERADDHWLQDLLKYSPNAGQTTVEFREDMQGFVTLRGRAVAEKIMSGNRVAALIPLDPRRLRTMIFEDMRRGYIYAASNGEERPLRQDQVFDISADAGCTSYTSGYGQQGGVIAYARESFGYSIGLEKHGRHFVRNRAIPGGVLSHPGSIKDDTAFKRLQRDWDEAFGAPNTGKVAILEEGMKWQSVGVSHADMEFLSSRKWTVNEVARWFNMPLSFLKVLDNAIKSNVEQQALEFKQFTIQPWLVRWEQAIVRDLIPPSERQTLFAEFNRRALMAMDFSARMQGYSQGLQNAIFNRNEVRRWENLNSIGDPGDVYTLQLNMMDLNQIGQSQPEMPQQDLSDDDEESDERARLSERRALRSAEERLRIQNAHMSMFTEAGTRIVRREAREIRKLIAKELRQRETLEDAIRQFYRDFPSVVEQNSRAAFTALAKVIAEAARREIGLDAELSPQWISEYVERIGIAYSISSRRQLVSIIRQSADVGEEDLAGRLEERVAGWVENRPGKYASRTIKTGAAAAALATYKSGGILRKRWMSFGSNCPSCQRLNGKVVGIDEVFVPAGSMVVPTDDEQTPIRVTRDIIHPQLHGGCDCQVSAAQ